MNFFGDFVLQDTFQERLASKSLEIDKDKLHMKFSALNIDFDSPSLECLGSRKPAHEGIKEWYLLQSFMKMVADRHAYAAYHNKH